MAPLLEIDRLSVSLFTRAGVLPAVDGLSLRVDAGETVAIVGESGCGKSLSALAVMRLLPEPPARIVGGAVRLAGRDLVPVSERAMQRVRGKDIAMIFQDPMTSLNPVVPIGAQLIEAIRQHNPISHRAAQARAVALLEKVRIPDAARRLDDYPHQLSGGMSQRVMIAMAIACESKVLIADEPTTALDVTIQAQILKLMQELQAASNMALVIITHDLGVVAETADRVAVMYAGRVAEIGPVRDVIKAPLHPYTKGLMGSIPSLTGESERLTQIPGAMPRLTAIPSGCAFHPRCPRSFVPCATFRPELQPEQKSQVACWLYQPYPVTAGAVT